MGGKIKTDMHIDTVLKNPTIKNTATFASYPAREQWMCQGEIAKRTEDRRAIFFF